MSFQTKPTIAIVARERDIAVFEIAKDNSRKPLCFFAWQWMSDPDDPEYDMVDYNETMSVLYRWIQREDFGLDAIVWEGFVD